MNRTEYRTSLIYYCYSSEKAEYWSCLNCKSKHSWDMHPSMEIWLHLSGPLPLFCNRGKTGCFRNGINLQLELITPEQIKIWHCYLISEKTSPERNCVEDIWYKSGLVSLIDFVRKLWNMQILLMLNVVINNPLALINNTPNT